MSDQQKANTGKISTDWLLRGVLTKVGDAFDRLTGRGYRPSSSLATSEIVEKLKKLLDHELRDGRFVPHNIKLKIQWDKFSTDSDNAIRTLENELKVAVIDHINDRRYHTYAPISLIVKPDYFTEGVKLLVSFDKFDKEDSEVAVNVTVPQIRVGDYLPDEPAVPEFVARSERFSATFRAAGKDRVVELAMTAGKRLSVGRGGENDLVIDDPSVSKMHASLVVGADGALAVADTGSTNGTFVAGNRIAYGKAVPVGPGGVLKFGNVEVAFEYLNPPEPEPVPGEEPATLVGGDALADAPTEEFRMPYDALAIPRPGEPGPTRIAVIKKIEEPAAPAAQPENEPTAERIVLDFDNKE